MDDVLKELISINKSHNQEMLASIKPELGSMQLYLLNQFESQSDFEILDDKAQMMGRVKLINKLANIVSSVKLSNFRRTRYFTDYFSTLRNLYSARLLLSLGAYSSGRWLMQKTIQKAIKLELWDAVLSGSSILISYYAIRQDNKSYSYYCRLADRSIALITREQELKRLLNKWILIFSQRRKTDENVIKALEGDIKGAEKGIQKDDPVNFYHLLYRLKLAYFDAKMDYENTLKVCELARESILSRTGYSDYNKFGIYHGVQMYCYLNLKEFKKARQFAEELDTYIPTETLNWYIFMEYFYVLSVQAKDYKKAFEIFESITNSKGFGQLRGVRGVVWKLLTGYMQFLVVSRIWKNPPKRIERKTFKVKKFTNEVFKLGSDKTGLQVSVLILQILFMLQQKNYGDIIEKKEALRRYIYRYLYSKENERSRFFLTMLLRMVECEFSYALTKEKTKRLLRLLKNQEMNYQANLGGNEIVDYELLWKWVLETLKQNWSTKLE